MEANELAALRHSVTSRSVKLVGFYAALATSLLTLLTFALAIFTPPLSGPFCMSGCFEYPYADIASRFPRDYVWMYPAMLLTLAFAVMVVAVHHDAPGDKRLFSHLGVCFAMISAATLLLDYFLQVSVVQPSLIAGEYESIAILTQFNPHGLFIALEDFGYLAMSFALLCTAPAISGTTKAGIAARWILLAGFALTIAAFIVISVQFGIHREYRFEVVVISINWLVLIASGALLTVVFRRGLESGASEQ